MNVTVFDDRACQLGEGPLWHPERQQFFWFDIVGKSLLSRIGDDQVDWQMDEHVSAAGWIDHDNLLVASETSLFQFNVENGDSEFVAALEAENPITRSNDGRADPFGGFWIGTMGMNAEDQAGAIYRYYRGEVRVLYPNQTIPNAICFSPDGTTAYFADTRVQKIWKQALSDKDGWPVGDPEVFLDCVPEGINPDGAVVDENGFVWNAQWGASRVARYADDGRLDLVINYPASQITCPAFGGEDLRSLYATSAAVGLSEDAAEAQPSAGKTFLTEAGVAGQKEHRVVL